MFVSSQPATPSLLIILPSLETDRALRSRWLRTDVQEQALHLTGHQHRFCKKNSLCLEQHRYHRQEPESPQSSSYLDSWTSMSWDLFPKFQLKIQAKISFLLLPISIKFCYHLELKDSFQHTALSLLQNIRLFCHNIPKGKNHSIISIENDWKIYLLIWRSLGIKNINLVPHGSGGRQLQSFWVRWHILVTLI